MLFPAAAAMLLAAGCAIGPNYQRPSAPVPAAFKEPPPPETFKEAQAAGFQEAEPLDAFHKGKWWQVYNDPALNDLEEQVAINNQNLLAAAATYREAKAAVRVARATLFPTVGSDPGITVSRAGSASANPNALVAPGVRRTYSLPFSISWEPDLWGNIHRSAAAAAATAQASYSDLENAKLLYQSELAQDYFQLHGTDGDMELLQRTVGSYQEYLTLTRNRFAGGVASDLDVAQAESQLYGAQSSLIELGVTRAQFEHAIAMLIGKPPAEVTIPPKILTTPPPAIPVALPSQLLERRPDIAAAERRVAAANEQIGIAMAAFYPTLSLTGSAGFQSGSFVKWFQAPSRFWSVGPALAETLFDGGRRRGLVAESRAAYDATVADYRQTVLTAFQAVEDNLAAMRIMAGEAVKVQQTIQAAQRALTVSTAQYKAGTTSYLTVITAQATLLNAQRTAVDLLTRRLTASVLLIEALGGGWQASDLPTNIEVSNGT
jgi:NodT family efflux transporter outer membrane factor (OMF) lipoprotein